MRRLVLFVLPWLAWAQACTTGRAVRPVGAGRMAVGASVGGPVITNLKVPVPIPITAAYLRVGASPRMDVDAAVYLPVSRVLGADVGASRLVLDQRGPRPALMLGLRLLSFVPLGRQSLPQLGRPRPLLEASARASWRVTAPQLPGLSGLAFVGADALAQVHGPALTPQLSVGYQGQLSRKWTWHAEARWLALGRDARAQVVHYAAVAGRGSLAVQLGASYAFAPFAPRLAETPTTARRVP